MRSRIEVRIKAFVRCAQDMNQEQHLPVLYLANSHFDFRDPASTDVPSGNLEFPRQFRLRPAAIAPHPPHFPTDNILMIHAASKDSEITPTRRDVATMAVKPVVFGQDRRLKQSVLRPARGS